MIAVAVVWIAAAVLAAVYVLWDEPAGRHRYHPKT